MRIVALVATILVVLWFGLRAIAPPAVVPASAPATAFSAERAMVDLRTIGQRPHPVATVDNARVRAYLAGRLRGLGVATEERHYLVDPVGYARLRSWNPQVSASAELVDLIGVLPGRDRAQPAVALMAHLDTVWGSPGAADDSIGVASILEILRAIRAKGMPARDIVVILTDGEEIGLSGARAFWPGDPLAKHVGVVVNLESRGAGGRAAMFETGTGNAAMIRLFGRGVAHPIADSMAVLAYRLMPNNTDFTVPHEQGLPGFNFANLGRAGYYHSPLAMADHVDPRSAQDMGDQALGTAVALAFAPKLPATGRDAVFFDYAGYGLVTYAIGTGWLLILGAALLWGVAVLRIRRLGIAPGEMFAGAGAMFWLLAHGVLALAAVNLLSGSARHPNYYDRLATLPMLEAQAVLAAAALLLGTFLLRRPVWRIAWLVPTLCLALLCWKQGAPHGLVVGCTLIGLPTGWFAGEKNQVRWGGWLGAIAVLLLIAIGLQAKAPLAAWIFAWPALTFALAAAVVAWTDAAFARPASWAIVAAAAMLVGIPLLPLAHLTFLGIGAPLAPALAPLLLIVAAGLWPLAQIERQRRAALIALALLAVAAMGIALKVRGAPLAPTVPGYSLNK